MDRTTTTVLAIVLGLAALVCVCAIVVFGAGVLFTRQLGNQVATEVAGFPTDLFVTTEPEDPTDEPEIIRTPVPTPAAGTSDTLETLQTEVIPESDLRELAMRLKGVGDVPEVVSTTPTDYEIGQELTFFATNTDTNENFEVTAELAYKTENVYFFVEQGVDVDLDGVQELVDDFQENTYPTNREFFGEEWNPGVDGDPRLYILYAGGLGFSVAGYYSSADEYSRLAHEFSNEKEMFYINADATGPGDPSLPGTLAHEFQHMIHWYHDRNEETWMNEGSSVLAEFLNGYGAGGFDASFTADPDLQLNAWTEGGPDDYTPPHYGAGFLFMTYFLDRFGNDATQAVVAHPDNGLRAVDEVLTAEGITDAATGEPVTAVDVFADWVIANYLGDEDVADGRYTYYNYPDYPRIEFPTDYLDCDDNQQATVRQFAADYYELECDGAVTVSFTGSQQVQVVPTMPNSGRYAFWSHRNDESDTRLTRSFDLTGLDSATLTYAAWWEIETDYDYAYLEVSTDGGEMWTIIETPSCTTDNPTGNNLGCGYTGDSGGGSRGEWIEESVDLSDYAGQEILIRFEYVTDAAVNRAGFMVDDIAVPELDYSIDFEDGEGDWVGEGFVWFDNLLPQEFVVQVIQAGDETTVQRMELDEANEGRLTLDLAAGETVTVVVSGITPFTTEVASYEVEISGN